jgi:bacterioferritin-associated ferredoxin
MYICNCNGITERTIRQAVELGCSSLEDLQRDLGVASCCGRCAPEARRLLGACAGGSAAGCACAGDD